MQCPVHKVDFKLIPAGVSKHTGKPYNAFFACPVKGCRETAPEKSVENVPAETKLQVPKEVWIQKERLLAMQTALNAASNVHQATGATEKVIADAKKFYELLRQAKQGILQREDILPVISEDKNSILFHIPF